MKQSYYTLIALGLLILAFVLAAVFYNAEQEQAANDRVTNNIEALERDYSPRLGNPDAKVTIVEFIDPACGTCAQFYPIVKEIMDYFGDKVNLVVRYAPLHPGSDEMVAILEAARKQDKFWEVLAMMFDTQAQWTENHQAMPVRFWGHLANVGFDIERLRADMLDPKIPQRIRQDVADGQLLGATRTPTFFVNGKPLATFGVDPLVNLIREEVNRNY